MPGGISEDPRNPYGLVPTSNQTSNTITTPTFQDPEFVKAMESLIGSLSNFGSQNFQSYIQDPASSPLFQTQLAGALSKLVPSEDISRRNLTDQFRAAGGLRSGAYGNASSLLEEAILNNRGKTISDVLGATYAPTLSGLLHPVDQISQIIAALKGQTTTSTQTGNTQSTFNQGGGGGGGIGGSSPTPYYNSLVGGNPGNPTAPSGGNNYASLPGVSNSGSQSWYSPDVPWSAGAFPPGEPGIIGGGSGQYSPNGFMDLIGDYSGINNTQSYQPEDYTPNFDFSQFDGGGY